MAPALSLPSTLRVAEHFSLLQFSPFPPLPKNPDRGCSLILDSEIGSEKDVVKKRPEEIPTRGHANVWLSP